MSQFAKRISSVVQLRLFFCLLITFMLAMPALAQQDHQPLPSNPQCTIQSFLSADRHVPPGARQVLAPDGTLRIGVNYGNPNNAKLLASGQLQGVAIDLGCILALRLGVEVEFVGYPGVDSFLQGFDAGQWTLGFTFDPDLGPPNFSYAHPHIGVQNTYLVPAGSLIQTPADADQPGVRISVARGNSPDIFLTANLQNATLVRFDTVPQALAALKMGQVDAFAGSRSAEVAFLSQLPGGRLLVDNFLVAHLAQVLPLGARAAVRYVDKFVESSKIDFLLQLASVRAGLVGVEVPAPIVKDDDQEDQEVDGGLPED